MSSQVAGFQRGWVFEGDEIAVDETAVVVPKHLPPPVDPQQLGFDLALPDEYGTKPMFD